MDMAYILIYHTSIVEGLEDLDFQPSIGNFVPRPRFLCVLFWAQLKVQCLCTDKKIDYSTWLMVPSNRRRNTGVEYG